MLSPSHCRPWSLVSSASFPWLVSLQRCQFYTTCPRRPPGSRGVVSHPVLVACCIGFRISVCFELNVLLFLASQGGSLDH